MHLLSRGEKKGKITHRKKTNEKNNESNSCIGG